jgi:hypothetical protein
MNEKGKQGKVQAELQNPLIAKIRAGKKLLPFVAFFLLALLFSPAVGSSQEADKNFIELKVKGKKIKVEVVRTEQEKAKGLMFREKLGKEDGMIFVYGKEEYLSFWMKNTRIPLSIAFLDRKGKIVDIQDMFPFSLQTHVSAFPAQYALEVNQGWFKQKGISIGDVVKLPANFEGFSKNFD